ncbi:hypothetical protein SUGI_0605490 [Cryptomeria japonica]|nr:hypothetical protein SUGI_0605490 [Cryptomeria japonica]
MPSVCNNPKGKEMRNREQKDVKALRMEKNGSEGKGPNGFKEAKGFVQHVRQISLQATGEREKDRPILSPHAGWEEEQRRAREQPIQEKRAKI